MHLRIPGIFTEYGPRIKVLVPWGKSEGQNRPSSQGRPFLGWVEEEDDK